LYLKTSTGKLFIIIRFLIIFNTRQEKSNFDTSFKHLIQLIVEILFDQLDERYCAIHIFNNSTVHHDFTINVGRPLYWHDHSQTSTNSHDLVTIVCAFLTDTCSRCTLVSRQSIQAMTKSTSVS